MFAECPKTIIDRLQYVLNAAAQVVSRIHKFDHGLTQVLHLELHWMDIPQQIQYKLGVMVHQCLHGRAHSAGCCTLTSDIANHQHLRSATHH